MTIENEEIEQEIDIVEEEIEEKIEGEAEEEAEEEAGDEDGEDKTEDDEDDEVVITIEGEEDQETKEEEAPQWVKELRREHRELKRENKKLKQSQHQTVSQGAPELPPKPKISDDGIDYDADIFDKKLDEWHEKKREHDNFLAKQEEQVKEEQIAWAQKLGEHNKRASTLGVPDYEDAQDTVKDTFSEIQQNAILHVCGNSAAVVYALGKNQARAEELSKITDNAKFIYELGKLESKMSISKKKKSPPKPDKPVKGGGPVISSDKKLAQLEAEADRTGDRSKVVKYKRELRNKG